jgi:hypothetical protein
MLHPIQAHHDAQHTLNFYWIARGCAQLTPLAPRCTQTHQMAKVFIARAFKETKLEAVGTYQVQSELQESFIRDHLCEACPSRHQWKRHGERTRHLGRYFPPSKQKVPILPVPDGRSAFLVFKKILDCTHCGVRFVFRLLRDARHGEGNKNSSERGQP